MSKLAKTIGGVLVGKVKTSLFAMVHIAAPNLVRFNIPPLNQKQFIFAPVSKQRINLYAMAAIQSCKNLAPLLKNQVGRNFTPIS
jgi:hypothetical protein